MLGGIKSTNALRTLHGSVSRTDHTLDGIAVVSEIVSSLVPRNAAEKLSTIYRAFRRSRDVPRPLHSISSSSHSYILEYVVGLMNNIRRLNPLIHQVLFASSRANLMTSVAIPYRSLTK